MNPFALALLVSISAAWPALGAAPASPAFDPRSWKGTIAGPPTEVLVLGAAHLSELPQKPTPSALALLLVKLEAFKPTVITVEGMTGEDCDLVTRYAAVYPDVADHYCWTTAAAEHATGLSVAAAEGELAKSLAALPARPTPAQRRHLAAVFLAANNRGSALVQWLRLPADERHSGDGLDDALVSLLKELEVKPNETYQLGSVLAARLGLEQIVPIDDHTSDRIEAGLGADFEKAIMEVWHAPKGPILEQVEAQRGATKSPADVLALYRRLNDPETLLATIRFDFGGALKHPAPERFGRQYVAWWETRNLRMAANIRAAFGNQPGARVLVIVGASHKPYLDAYLDLMHEVRLVDARNVLE